MLALAATRQLGRTSKHAAEADGGEGRAFIDAVDQTEHSRAVLIAEHQFVLGMAGKREGDFGRSKIEKIGAAAVARDDSLLAVDLACHAWTIRKGDGCRHHIVPGKAAPAKIGREPRSRRVHVAKALIDSG